MIVYTERAVWIFYNKNKLLTFVGRKDAQVKIYGQRVKVDDIENYITQIS